MNGRPVLQQWGSVFIAASVVVSVSAGATVSNPLPTNSAEIRLLGTTIGVGPSFDGFGMSIPLFFYGTVVPQGDSFHSVPYPAQINLNYPAISDLSVLSDIPYWPQTMTRSEGVGAGYLERDIAASPVGEKTTIIGMSQGAQVAEIVRADMSEDSSYVANAQNYEFVLLGDPYQPNGGILARFTSLSDLPVLGDLLPFGRPGPSDSPFETTYYQNQYDGLADFPAYFNVLAVTNALVGIVFEHMLPGYLLESPDGANVLATTVGNTTYVTIPQPLPLLAPMRVAASLVGAQRFVDAIDPVLRVFVEMGYDRTADPSQVMEFRGTIPEEKVRAGLDELPAAFAQSLEILGGATYMPTVPRAVVSGAVDPTPVTEHPAQPVDSSPEAQAVRQAVVNVAGLLTGVTQSLATMLQTLDDRPSSYSDTQSVDVTGSAPEAMPTEQALPETGADAADTPGSSLAALDDPDPIDFPSPAQSAADHVAQQVSGADTDSRSTAVQGTNRNRPEVVETHLIAARTEPPESTVDDAPNTADPESTVDDAPNTTDPASTGDDAPIAADSSHRDDPSDAVGSVEAARPGRAVHPSDDVNDEQGGRGLAGRR